MASTHQVANQQLAREWRAVARFPHAWRPCVNQAGVLGDIGAGEAGGLFVECEQVPNRRAYMKPRVRDPRVEFRRAAREKICADLAHELGVHVPPVVLAEREAEGEEQFVSVSLVLYPAQWAWGQVRMRVQQPDTPASALMQRAIRMSAAPAFAFDTWVAQTDHGDHPHNIVFGYDPANIDDCAVVFLDFSFSLGVGGGWQGEGARVCHAAAFPHRMLSVLDPAELKATVEAIEAFDPAVIESVVGRIPDEYLAAAERDLIGKSLIARRSLVRTALSQHLRTGAQP